jgi:hypothetical protein
MALALAFALGAGSAQALIYTYIVPLDGAQEVGAAGDPDGFGTATLQIDDSFSPLKVTWTIPFFNISTVADAHIHQAPFGTNGGVVVPFGPGQSPPGTLSGMIQDADLTNVIANPYGFYVNVHSSEFPAGAIRGQIPEPTTLLLVGAGLLGFAASSRRRIR